jgi:hypothetical protein
MPHRTLLPRASTCRFDFGANKENKKQAAVTAHCCRASKYRFGFGRAALAAPLIILRHAFPCARFSPCCWSTPSFSATLTHRLETPIELPAGDVFVQKNPKCCLFIVSLPCQIEQTFAPYSLIARDL